jgi:DNA-binding NarL/FixJ family response regulator
MALQTITKTDEEMRCLMDRLTPREREVLTLVAGGKRNKEIAVTLVISEATVENHLNHIFGKLGVATRTQATLCYLQARSDQGAWIPNDGNPS